MQNLEKEGFYKLECLVNQLTDVKEALWLMQERYLTKDINTIDFKTIINNYKDMQVINLTSFNQLSYQLEEMDNYINEVYEERKRQRRKGEMK